MSDKITIGRCKDCKFRNKDRRCINEDKIHEDWYGAHSENDHMIYSYYEDGWFTVGENFGCVHWTSK